HNKQAYLHDNKESSQNNPVVLSNSEEITPEEQEILEAFEYLSDKEFNEFIGLVGLTRSDVDRLRAKAGASALKRVTRDIMSNKAKLEAESLIKNIRHYQHQSKKKISE